MAKRSVSASKLAAIEDKINDNPHALQEFLEAPADYLRANGVALSKRRRKELEDTLSEMRIGPESFDDLASLSKRPLGVGIAIRIQF